MVVNRRRKMTTLELRQIVCKILDVLSYRIGLQYRGRNHVSEYIMDILDCYPGNQVLSEEEVDKLMNG